MVKKKVKKMVETEVEIDEEVTPVEETTESVVNPPEEGKPTTEETQSLADAEDTGPAVKPNVHLFVLRDHRGHVVHQQETIVPDGATPGPFIRPQNMPHGVYTVMETFTGSVDIEPYERPFTLNLS